MCYSSTAMNQGRTSRRPEDQGIYPDIASFFAANTEAQQQQQQGMGQQITHGILVLLLYHRVANLFVHTLFEERKFKNILPKR